MERFGLGLTQGVIEGQGLTEIAHVDTNIRHSDQMHVCVWISMRGRSLHQLEEHPIRITKEHKSIDGNSVRFGKKFNPFGFQKGHIAGKIGG